MHEGNLPPASGKQEFSIGEVAEILDVKAHTIRFWEKSFNIQVNRKDSGRRIYNLSDISLLKKIQKMLHKENMKIRGAKERLEAEGAITGDTRSGFTDTLPEPSAPPSAKASSDTPPAEYPVTEPHRTSQGDEVLNELKEILNLLEPASR